MGIVVRHLSFTYLAGTPLAVRALDDVSLEVRDGEAVGLIGPTGSGKSTLVQHFNGLLGKPPPGCVVVDGIDLGARRPDLRRLRQRVGLLFQYPEHQLFEETVAKDVAFGPKAAGLDEETVERRVTSALRLVGLDPEQLAPRSPFQLSGGQKRRVAIAGVLALEPSILILDEPTAGLDPQGRAEFRRLLRRLHRRGLTLVVVSHHVDELAEMVDRVVVLRAGRVVADAPIPQLFTHHRALLEEVGLAVPTTVELMWRLQARGAPVPVDCLTPAEAAEAIARWLGRGRRRHAHGSRSGTVRSR